MSLPARPDLSASIAGHLPFLRRFARAVTGRQDAGDAHALAALEAILSNPGVFDQRLAPRVALFRVFYQVWFSAGAEVLAPGVEEGDLAQSAQRHLGHLAPESRVALLLSSLEGFGDEAVAAIMGIPIETAANLVRAGNAEIDRQVAGRVLIIEDEPIIAMDIEAIVTGLGHRVTGIAETRDSAVEKAMAKPPNLVLADIQLADGSSGIDAVNDIVEAFPVPVIFITAYPERLLTGERPEPAFLITKPFRESQMRAAIGQALFFQTVLDEA